MATTTPISDEVPLIDRVRALPQELIDQIQDEVFKCEPAKKGLRHVIRVAPYDLECHFRYRLDRPDSSSLLYVSKATREEFTASFFSSSFSIAGLGEARRWLRSLTAQRRGLIQEVRVYCGYWSGNSPILSLYQELLKCELPDIEGRMVLVT